jgi:hypothetical protein
MLKNIKNKIKYFAKGLYSMQSEILKYKILENMPSINKYEHRVYSQHGEDGIIEEIFSRIGTTNKFFFECGAGEGEQNNTIFLLMKGWSGLWLEGADFNFNNLKKIFTKYTSEKKLKINKGLISSKNINILLEEASVPKDLDFMSIDIDSNDYYIFESLTYKPRVLCIEYNSTFRPGFSYKQKESEKEWNGSFLFGANISALNIIAKEKNYTLVCTDMTGTNAFFVRNDCLKDSFERAGDVNFLYNKPRYYLYYDIGHKLEIEN